MRRFVFAGSCAAGKHIYVYMNIYTYHIHLSLSLCISLSLYIYIYIYIYICLSLSIYIYIIYIYIYMHIYIYIYTSNALKQQHTNINNETHTHTYNTHHPMLSRSHIFKRVVTLIVSFYGAIYYTPEIAQVTIHWETPCNSHWTILVKSTGQVTILWWNMKQDMNLCWKMLPKVHWKTPLNVHDDFRGVDFWCAIFCPYLS